MEMVMNSKNLTSGAVSAVEGGTMGVILALDN